jgi:4-hydroxy-tetrahydrodipicolinate synthase
LANDFKKHCCYKLTGDMVQAIQMIKKNKQKFLVISDLMMLIPMVLAGGSGVISVIGQGFPKEFSENSIKLKLQGR